MKITLFFNFSIKKLFFFIKKTDEINEKLVSKGEQRERLTYQMLSDIDGCDKDTPFGKLSLEIN